MKNYSRIIRASLIIAITLLIYSSTTVYENSISNSSIHNTVNLSLMATKITDVDEEGLYVPEDTLTGELTGYVYNCPLCTGRLACKSNMDLSNGTISYIDSEYGEVRIVASSRDLPCESIVRFESDRVSDKPVYAIVLDRGVGGNSLDLLVENLDAAYTTIGRSTIDYEILRYGNGE